MNPRLLALKEKFLRGSRDRIDGMARALELVVANRTDPEAAQDLMRRFHSLAGLAGTHGLHTITDISRKAEQRCARWIEAGSTPSTEELAELHDAIEKLRRAFRGATEIEETEEMDPDQPPEILVVEPDPATAAALARELALEGFATLSAATMAEARSILQSRTPRGLITGTRLPDGAGFELIETLRRTRHRSAAPVVVLGTEPNFLDKVQAIRSGANSYVEKPLDAASVARKIRELFDPEPPSGIRILSVEDDADQSEFNRAVLEAAGYEVRVCDNPRYLETDLMTFRPDLILMDIVLPNLSGYDLARFIRQDESYSTVPILFLTTEAQARMEIMRAGGDEHLIKPVSPALLLTAVAQRLERARSVQRLIERDGLTGLLTHSAFLERARAAMTTPGAQASTVLVMIDIDDFKSINDRFGHPVGDRVLASLASLLRRRVRIYDLAGRYGGDEFALVLHRIKPEDAGALMSRLLAEFGKLGLPLPDGTIVYATFSAGLATLGDATSLDQWKAAADGALYEAKRAGANTVRQA